MKEFDAYVDEVREILFENDKQRTLNQESEALERIRRFIRLELTKDDWDDINKANGTDEPLFSELETRVFYDFYRSVDARDFAMFQNLCTIFCSTKSKTRKEVDQITENVRVLKNDSNE